MTISLEKPFTFSLTGQRALNEDFVLPVDERSRLFVVCDGIGGWDKGEVASRLVAETVAGYFGENPADYVSENYLSESATSAYLALAGYLRENPLVNRLGSTLALLHLNEKGATVAHIGDSRVYHLREGRILHQTQDHKYVQELVADGIITEEQALTHPRRNALSRSVGAESGQMPPRMDKVETTQLTDVRAGDYFFLCTDGVLEQVDAGTLETIFSRCNQAEEVVSQILSRCQNATRDNYSGCVVKIKEIPNVPPSDFTENF